jgi:RNA polymerase sigma-70 factor (ECF subfamily)
VGGRSPNFEMNRSFLVPRRLEEGSPPAEPPFVERKPDRPGIDTQVVAATDMVPFLAASALEGPRSGVTIAPLAFDRVYQAHAAFVWRVLRGMGVSDATIEDAVQDVFMVVHRRLAEFDGLGSLKTWLFQIAYRTACAYRRKQRRAGDHEPFDDRVEARTRPPTPAEEAERRETMSLVADLLDGLADEKRAVLVLADIEEMTAPEIAVVTGTPLNTVYTRLRRARTELSQALRAIQRRGR